MQNLSIRLILFLVLIMAGVSYGCWFTQLPQGDNGNPDRAELLLKGTYGLSTSAEPSATWIKDQATLDMLYQDLNARIGGKSVETPQIDFKKFGVLYLEMGQKPTGGYSIDFEPSKIKTLNKRLEIHISWKFPAQGMAVTQAVTSPFIFLKLDKTNITSILVLDQDDISRFEFPVK